MKDFLSFLFSKDFSQNIDHWKGNTYTMRFTQRFHSSDMENLLSMSIVNWQFQWKISQEEMIDLTRNVSHEKESFHVIRKDCQ